MQFPKSTHSVPGAFNIRSGIEPVPGTLQSTRNMPPKNTREVKQFQCLVGNYRKFTTHFADFGRPFINLTRKDTRFEWITQCRDAFYLLNQSVMEET